MEFFSCVVIVAGIRLMVGMMLGVMDYTFRINHIEIPVSGWKLEALELLITLTIAEPIVSFISVAKA
jgi:hypothetical protein